MRENIDYKNQKFVIETTFLTGDEKECWETKIFRIQNGEIDDNEVYLFQTFEAENAMRQHARIMTCPRLYVAEEAIESYLKKKNNIQGHQDRIISNRQPRDINIVKLRKILFDVQMFCKKQKRELPMMLAGTNEVYFIENKELCKRQLTAYEFGFLNGQHAAYKHISQHIETICCDAKRKWEDLYCREEWEKMK